MGYMQQHRPPPINDRIGLNQLAASMELFESFDLNDGIL